MSGRFWQAVPIVILIGVAVAAASTFIYVNEEGFMAFVTPQRAAFFTLVAETYLVVLLVGVAMVFLGLREEVASRQRTTVARGVTPLSPAWLIPHVLSVKKYRRYFVAAAVLYGLFYAAITSMIVYQPGVDFGQAYGASLPSAVVTACCGAPLYSPVVTVYVVNHLGLLLIPLTVLLLLATSTLVGLNFALVAFAFDSRAKGVGRGWVGGLGAMVGLFTGCPTCAGLFFANVLGGGGAVSFAVLLAYYQPVFILLSLPVLLATPYLISRSLGRVFREGCVVLDETRRSAAQV
ncbi:MAG: hypothetical protein OK438_07430 [Thaumarchaeota archaeon]|nr:hypothetical protein [Nitrososphaerota archaeon]